MAMPSTVFCGEAPAARALGRPTRIGWRAESPTYCSTKAKSGSEPSPSRRPAPCGRGPSRRGTSRPGRARPGGRAECRRSPGSARNPPTRRRRRRPRRNPPAASGSARPAGLRRARRRRGGAGSALPCPPGQASRRRPERRGPRGRARRGAPPASRGAERRTHASAFVSEAALRRPRVSPMIAGTIAPGRGPVLDQRPGPRGRARAARLPARVPARMSELPSRMAVVETPLNRRRYPISSCM